MGCIGVYNVSNLSLPTDEESFLTEGSYDGKSALMMRSESGFGSGSQSNNLVVIIAWGIEGWDDAGTDVWDVEDFGVLLWDEDFQSNLWRPESQEFMLEFCNATQENAAALSLTPRFVQN